MTTTLNISLDLSRRRRSLGMSFAIVAKRSGVSEPTVKRILGGQAPAASFSNVAAVAKALGMTIGFEEMDAEALRRDQASRKAKRVAHMVQGTSALESQAVDKETYQRLVDQSFHELLAGSNRRLWSS